MDQDIIAVKEETAKMIRRMDNYAINEAAGLGAIHQGIHHTEAETRALLLHVKLSSTSSTQTLR